MKYIIFLTGCAALNINNFPRHSFLLPSASTAQLHMPPVSVLTWPPFVFISFHILTEELHPSSCVRANVCNIEVTAAKFACCSCFAHTYFLLQLSLSSAMLFCLLHTVRAGFASRVITQRPSFGVSAYSPVLISSLMGCSARVATQHHMGMLPVSLWAYIGGCHRIK